MRIFCQLCNFISTFIVVVSIKFFSICVDEEHTSFAAIFTQQTTNRNRDKKFYSFFFDTLVLEKPFTLLSSWLFSLLFIIERLKWSNWNLHWYGCRNFAQELVQTKNRAKRQWIDTQLWMNYHVPLYSASCVHNCLLASLSYKLKR